MAVYEPVARGKKLGEKLLRGKIRLHNERATDGGHIKFGQVCGQGVDGTITMKLLHRLYPNEVAEIKQAAEGGKLPEIADMAQAIAKMAEGDFQDEETVFIGVPQITPDDMPRALPMYNPQTRYIDSLIGLDRQRAIGFYRVEDKDTHPHFSFAGNDEGGLTINEAHTAGHFTPEFNLSVFPGHKIVAAALDIATVNLEDTSDDFIIPRLESIGEIKFRIPVLPGDKLRFVPAGTDFSVRIGSIEAATISGLKLGPRNLAAPKNMTPDRLIEAGAQTLGLAYIRNINLTDILPLFGGIRGPIEYQRDVLPGELLEMEAVITDGDGKGFNGDVTFRIDDKVVAQATGYTCQLRSRKSIERGIRMSRKVLG